MIKTLVEDEYALKIFWYFFRLGQLTQMSIYIIFTMKQDYYIDCYESKLPYAIGRKIYVCYYLYDAKLRLLQNGQRMATAKGHLFYRIQCRCRHATRGGDGQKIGPDGRTGYRYRRQNHSWLQQARN